MAKAKIVFLGTSASTPSKERNLSSISLSFEGKQMLFDCAEGTQRQMMKAGLSFMKIDYVFLSHFHGDHVLGLPGLIATNSMHKRKEALKVFGPKGVAKKVKEATDLSGHTVTFPIQTKELKNGVVLKEEKFLVKAFTLRHRTKCFGFVFETIEKKGKFVKEKALALGIPESPLYRKLQEGKKVKWKGKTFYPKQVMDYSQKKKARKIAVVPDTLAGGYEDKIREADLLIHESSFLEELKERAIETKHSTALGAGRVAKKANVKALYLYHISIRYSGKEAEEEAKKEFPYTKAAKDLDVVEV